MPIICERCCVDAASAEAGTVKDVDRINKELHHRLGMLLVTLSVEEDGWGHSIYVFIAKAVRYSLS